MTNVIQIRRPVELACSACGSIAEAPCDCGAPYLPASCLAAEAIAANPQMSNRAIAKVAGVSFETVRRARQSTDTGVSVEAETRIGLDGKARRLPRREEARPEPPRKKDAFLLFANEAMLLATYDGPVDEEIIEAARDTAAAWRRLVKQMEK